MPRTVDSTLLEQLLAVKLSPVYFYRIEVSDSGTGTGSLNTLTDTSKKWSANEWVDSTATLVDYAGTEFQITANSTNTISVSGTPSDGNYTVRKWICLTPFHGPAVGGMGAYDSLTPGGFVPINFPTGSVYNYRPYSISHKQSTDNEIGQYPQTNIEIFNPNVSYLNLYVMLNRFNGLKNRRIYIIQAFVDSDGVLIEAEQSCITDIYIIVDVSITNVKLTFTVQSLGNIGNKKVPDRTYTKLTCGWGYGDENCKHISAGNRPSGVDISTCNKTFRQNFISSRWMTFQSEDSEGEHFIVSGGFGGTISEGQLIGCLVYTGSTDYFWEVVDHDTVDEIVVDSYSRQSKLQDYTKWRRVVQGGQEGGIVEADIIDKYCCYGHNDTGKQRFKHAICYDEDLVSLLPFRTYNNLIFNGNFEMDLTAPWTSGSDGSIEYSVTSGGLFVEGASGSLTLSQTVITTDMGFETGKQVDLVSRYYGFDMVDSENSVIKCVLYASVNGSDYYYSTASGWVENASSLYVAMPLRGYDFRTALSANFLKYIKTDQYAERVPLIFDNYRGIIDELTITVTIGRLSPSTNRSNAYIDSIGLYPFIQSQHYGAFPSIQTSKYWRT